MKAIGYQIYQMVMEDKHGQKMKGHLPMKGNLLMVKRTGWENMCLRINGNTKVNL